MDFTKLFGNANKAVGADNPVATTPVLQAQDAVTSPFIATEVVGGWTGLLVEWKLSDLQISNDELKARVKASGLPAGNFPKECAPAKALTYAIKDVAKVADNHIKQVSGTRWTQVTKVNTEDDGVGKQNKYVFDFKAKVEVNSLGVVGASSETVVIEPADHILSKVLKERYLWRRKNIVGSDVSSAMTGHVVPALNGIGVPAWQGGRYFIPAAHKDEWDRYLQVFDGFGGKFYGIPATKDEGDLCELISDSLRHKATLQVNSLEKTLGDEAGEAALKTSIDKGAADLKLYENYEKMLGIKLIEQKRVTAEALIKLGEARMVLLSKKAK